MQVISAALQQAATLEEAVNAPRYHLRRARTRKEPDQYVEVEPDFGEEWTREMTDLGWDIHVVSRDEYYFGGVNGIDFAGGMGGPVGVSDPRRSNYVSTAEN